MSWYTPVVEFATNGLKWLETRLDEGLWFRRIYVIVATYLTWSVVKWAMHFAEITKLSGIEAAALVAAVAGPVAAIQAYAFNNYLNSK